MVSRDRRLDELVALGVDDIDGIVEMAIVVIEVVTKAVGTVKAAEVDLTGMLVSGLDGPANGSKFVLPSSMLKISLTAVSKFVDGKSTTCVTAGGRENPVKVGH